MSVTVLLHKLRQTTSSPAALLPLPSIYLFGPALHSELNIWISSLPKLGWATTAVLYHWCISLTLFIIIFIIIIITINNYLQIQHGVNEQSFPVAEFIGRKRCKKATWIGSCSLPGQFHLVYSTVDKLMVHHYFCRWVFWLIQFWILYVSKRLHASSNPVEIWSQLKCLLWDIALSSRTSALLERRVVPIAEHQTLCITYIHFLLPPHISR